LFREGHSGVRRYLEKICWVYDKSEVKDWAGGPLACLGGGLGDDCLDLLRTDAPPVVNCEERAIFRGGGRFRNEEARKT